MSFCVTENAITIEDFNGFLPNEYFRNNQFLFSVNLLCRWLCRLSIKRACRLQRLGFRLCREVNVAADMGELILSLAAPLWSSRRAAARLDISFLVPPQSGRHTSARIYCVTDHHSARLATQTATDRRAGGHTYTHAVIGKVNVYDLVWIHGTRYIYK